MLLWPLGVVQIWTLKNKWVLDRIVNIKILRKEQIMSNPEECYV